jgi:hypothetical protein
MSLLDYGLTANLKAKAYMVALQEAIIWVCIDTSQTVCTSELICRPYSVPYVKHTTNSNNVGVGTIMLELVVCITFRRVAWMKKPHWLGL